jgi:hypothetical protein
MTDNEILAKLFKVVNVSPVTSIIDGEVFLGEKPIERTSEDIVIGVLVSKSEFNGSLTTGTVNINCFTKAINNHTRDAKRLNTITGVVITALGLTYDEGHTGLLNYKFESQKTFRDFDNPSMYYSNIKLRFSHKNN